jgi:hemolysin III
MAEEEILERSSWGISLEELVNSTTHGIGLLLSVAGFVVLLAMALRYGTAWHVVSCAIYGTTLICLYLASTLYHGITSPRLRRALRILDHSAIYLLIAGTYTPFLLVNLRGGWGWSLLGIVWGCAMAGIVLKFWFVGHFKVLSTVLYLAMGWLVVIAARPLVTHVSAVGLRWLVAGGVMCTVGVVFFASRKIPFGHAVWHIFVMAGSVCHYLAVLYAVVLPTKI